MKIKYVNLGQRYKSTNGTGKVGIATCTLLKEDPNRSEVQLTGDFGSQWFVVSDIEPVDESPKEATVKIGTSPTPESIGFDPTLPRQYLHIGAQPAPTITPNGGATTFQFLQPGKPLSIADTPVSQMTFRHALVLAIAAMVSTTDAVDFADRVIAEMENKKK